MCPKATFAEQVDGLTVRYQRRTPLLQRLVEIAGVLLAGRGGARLLRLLNAGLSRTSVLAQLMKMPPKPTAPRVLGVDDFALYGRIYGTLLVDEETRLPITLREGRDAETLRDWLLEHPGVQIACRDGSPIYRQGLTNGAPDAIQVSDRSHLWQGLSRRIQQIAAAHRDCLTAAAHDPDPGPPADTEPQDIDSPANSPAADHAQRLFEAVHALTDTGRSYNSVARELGLNWRTVRRYATATRWQDCVRRRPRIPSPLDRHLEYLRQRWGEGEHNAKVLHEEIKAKGYLGHYQRVKLAVAPLRRGLPINQPTSVAYHPAKSPAGSPPARRTGPSTRSNACSGYSCTAPNST
ncbi:transposase [Actinoplanes sp. NPDC049265]|uniref:transposase n=1 Tax=Actinoplanes sp. NPDC049265 TaxID=3363902 RepID=UPI0037120FA5